MGWVVIENPSQELLDEVMARSRAHMGPCHDCGVEPGEAHTEGCDTARCKICGGQRLQCDCEGGDGDIWTGMWPGTEEAYKLRLLCKWESTVQQYEGEGLPRFDFNRLAVLRVTGRL